MTRLLFILLLVFGISFGLASAWAGEPFTAPDGTAYPDDVQAVLAEAKEAYVSKDFREVFNLMLPLAEAGHAEAQYRLGILYGNGFGVEKEGELAARWYAYATNQGHIDARHNLAVLLHKGDLVPQDYEKAAELFSQNARLDHPESQAGLGLLLIGGKGIKRDFSEGFAWLFQAEANGSVTASKAIKYFSSFVPSEHIHDGRQRATERARRSN